MPDVTQTPTRGRGSEIWRALHRLGSPPHFYRWSGRLVPPLALAALALALWGLWGGLVAAPADYQQGDAFRIIYVHVPSAWMSLFVYVFMAACAAVGYVWRVKVAEVLASAAAPAGAVFTLAALVTGSLWGRPMWGTYWEWDARLTSELILLFLYLGYIALESAIENPRTAARACAILAAAGLVNVPIVHFSVEWWNTLHQGPTVSKFGKPSIHTDMLVPLLVMTMAFQLYFFANLLARARVRLLWRERDSRWVRAVVDAQGRTE